MKGWLDSRYLSSLAGFAACVAVFMSALWLFVRLGGLWAAVVIGVFAAVLLHWFYRGARPDLPSRQPGRKETR